MAEPVKTIIPKEALAYLKQKGMKPTASHSDIWGEEHTAAFTVAGIMEKDVLLDIQTSLATALEMGIPFNEWAKQLKPTLVKAGWDSDSNVAPRRIRTIYETNMKVARAVGQWDRITKTQKALPYLQYMLGPAERHRPEHVAFAGTILPVNDPWWDTHFPPNGYGCHCWVKQLTKNQGADKITASPSQVVPSGGWDYNPGKSRQEQLEEYAETGYEPTTFADRLADVLTLALAKRGGKGHYKTSKNGKKYYYSYEKKGKAGGGGGASGETHAPEAHDQELSKVDQVRAEAKAALEKVKSDPSLTPTQKQAVTEMQAKADVAIQKHAADGLSPEKVQELKTELVAKAEAKVKAIANPTPVSHDTEKGKAAAPEPQKGGWKVSANGKKYWKAAPKVKAPAGEEAKPAAAAAPEAKKGGWKVSASGKKYWSQPYKNKAAKEAEKVAKAGGPTTKPAAPIHNPKPLGAPTATTPIAPYMKAPPPVKIQTPGASQEVHDVINSYAISKAGAQAHLNVLGNHLTNQLDKLAAHDSGKKPLSHEERTETKANIEHLTKASKGLHHKIIAGGFDSTVGAAPKAPVKKPAFKPAPKDENGFHTDVKSWKADLEKAAPHQAKAVHSWIGSGYTNMRAVDRGELKSNMAAKSLKDLKEALATAPRHEGTLYRGIRMKPDQIAALQVGGHHTENALHSWSPDMKLAQGFGGGSSESVVFKVTPISKNSRHIQDKNSQVGGETEVLMPKGHFKITHIEEQASPYPGGKPGRLVHVEEIVSEW